MTQHNDDSRDQLVKLGDTHLTLSDSGQDIRNRKVLDADGKDIGHVSALFIDKRERKIRFIQVGAGGFLGIGEREFLVPIEDVTSISPSEVRISHSLEHVIGSPVYDPALTTERTRDFWNPYYGYYGFAPYWGVWGAGL